jgi:hypothetical protein
VKHGSELSEETALCANQRDQIAQTHELLAARSQKNYNRPSLLLEAGHVPYRYINPDCPGPNPAHNHSELKAESSVNSEITVSVNGPYIASPEEIVKEEEAVPAIFASIYLALAASIIFSL